MGFPGTGKIWMNGKFVDWKDANIHIATHVIHYGSGVFEGARCYSTPKGSACFRLEPHMRRLMESAKIYRMEYPLDLQGWMNVVLDTIRVNEMKACYIRPLLYRGYKALGVNPLNIPVDAAIMVWDWGAYLGADALEDGVDVKISSWTRMAPNTLPAMAKSTANYANSALIKMEAVADGYSEAIALDVNGNLSEGSGQNLFIVRDGAHLHAAARLVDPRRHHARLDHHAGARGRLHGDGMRAAPRVALHRRRGVLRRHRRRSDAGPVGGQDQGRCGQAGPDHKGAADAPSSRSSTAKCPTATAGSPTSIPKKPRSERPKVVAARGR